MVRFNNIFIYISLWVIQTQRVRTGPAVDAVRARTGNKRAGQGEWGLDTPAMPVSGNALHGPQT